MLDLCKYYFVSGMAFFGGAGVVATACLLGLFCKAKWAKRLVPFLLALGFIMMLVSTTPIVQWFYGVWLISGMAWMGAERFWSGHAKTFGWVVLVFTVFGVILESPYHRIRDIPGQFDELFVIGDSVSEGIGREKEPWPAVLAAEHDVKVINLAVAGATVHSAMRQARKIGEGKTLVLLEIGGNDLLGNTAPSEFEKNLDDLLQALSSESGRTLVMFELPLFPSRQAFGRIQRKLASKYNVTLIPKRCFAEIVCSSGATVDGIHLSDLGHKRMAEMVWNLLGRSMVKLNGG